MATAAPHVKLLRQLSDARDDYRSGALDVDWGSGHATLFMVFGQPSHAVFEEEGKGRVEGNAALAAMLRDLPPHFSVEPWRRAMTPSESLHCTIDDLVHHFADLAAAHAPSDPAFDQGPSLRFAAGDDSPDLAFDLTSFPLLPEGDKLAGDVPAPDADVIGLAERLGSGLVTLAGPRLRAAATVRNGALSDAVWVEVESHATGETAAMAIVGATEGSLTACRLGAELASALPMIWRLPVEQRAMNLRWLDPDALMGTFSDGGDDRVVLVDAPRRGVGLFLRNELLAVYSSELRRPAADPQVFRDLLSQSEGRMTVLRRAAREHAPGELARAASLVARLPPDGWSSAGDGASDLGVDFGEVRRELAQICDSWLGERDGQVAIALLEQTRPSVDDFVSTIDAIRSLQLPGYEPSLIQAMAKELHIRAAERLCAT